MERTSNDQPSQRNLRTVKQPPGAAVPSPGAAVPSPRALSNLTIVALVISRLAILASLASTIYEMQLYQSILAGEEVDTNAGQHSSGIPETWYAVRFLAAIAFLAWIYRLSHNLPFLTGKNQRYWPAKCVICWFIPFVNLVLPYLVVKYIRANSMTQDGTTPPNPGSPLVAAWWATWVGAYIPYISAWFIQQDTPEAAITAARLTITGDSLELVCAVLAIFLVHRITSSQIDKNNSLSTNSALDPS